MNPIEAGLTREWQAVYGDLNLWDFFVMNDYLKYKRDIDSVVASHNRRQAAIKTAKTNLK